MVELKARDAFEELLPLEVGEVSLTARDFGPLTLLGDLGDGEALQAALGQAHGLDLPDPLRSTENGSVRCLWFGQGQSLLIDAEPDPGLAKHAAVVDVTDAWAAAELSGAAGAEVLARLVPVDLRAAVFPSGHSLRSLMREVPVSITRLDAHRLLLLLPRSMVASAIADLRRAMEAVASRR